MPDTTCFLLVLNTSYVQEEIRLTTIRRKRRRRRLKPVPVILLCCLLVFCIGKIAISLTGSSGPGRVLTADDANGVTTLAAEPGEVPTGTDYYSIVVNNAHPLAEDFVPANLVDIRDGAYQLETQTAAAYQEMKKAMAKEQMILNMESGYRTYNQQKSRVKSKAEELKEADTSLSSADAEKEALLYEQAAGTCEHQTGLAFDVSMEGWSSDDFATSQEGQWLQAHAAEYGFIIRYPAAKAAITGVAHEPNHLRYVGVELAKAIQESGLCLEEYFNKPIQ